jgi:DNA polymerase-3 subunit alpha
MYRLIEEYTGYTHAPGTYPTFNGPGGRTLPSPALVEDDQGQRLLIVAQQIETLRCLNARLWHQAHTGGAAAIVWQEDDGYVALLTEHFIEDRIEDRDLGFYGVAAFGREVVFDHPPAWTEVATKALAEPLAEPVAASGFTHLHLHTEFSALDGLSKMDEVMDAVEANGQSAVGVTDHGTCAGQAAQQKAALERGIKPIFGIEAYFVDDRRFRGPTDPKPTLRQVNDRAEFDRLMAQWESERKRGRDYWHLVLWAANDEGLHNLWALSTEASRTGMHYKPRMDWELLERHASGLLVSTACLRGPISQALLDENHELADARLGRLSSIFDGRCFVEIHTNQLPEQRLLNERLVQVAAQHSLPLVAVTDSHYPTTEHKHCHKVWMAVQTDSDLTEDAELFAGDHDYHIMSEAEVRQSLAYLPSSVVDQAVASTTLIADACDAKIGGTPGAPVFSKRGTREDRVQADVERLVDICLANWHKVEGKPPCESTGETYEARFEREMRLLIEKGFCGYFLQVSDYCMWARSQGILVGPGRGSGGGCLVAYLCEITDIDPIEADLIFERFLTQGRKSLPDFDVDFPQSKREVLTQRQIDRYGEDRVVRVGTQTRDKNKGIIRSLARVLNTRADAEVILHPDINAICDLFDEADHDTAGMGKPWAEAVAQIGEKLDPFVAQYPELFALAEQLVGRIKSYGKHPAGLVIDPEESLDGRLPMRWTDGEAIESRAIAEWDMVTLEDVLHLVKFDLLTLRNLDTLQACMDLVAERQGVTLNPYAWTRDGEYADPDVWDDICEGRTLGLFQVETYLGTDMCKRYKPRDLHGLADVVTLVRPGPRDSGLTDIYLRRRWGHEDVSFPHPLLEQVLGRTLGCVLYQEDVMNVCMTLAGYDENEADAVRKMLGKKKVEEVEAAGRKFVTAATGRDIAAEVSGPLWANMAEFAKYSFNRAHAYGYAIVAYWCAWMKHHYPAEFLAAALSTVDGKRIPEFVTEARRRGFKVLPPDVNESDIGFTVVDDHTVRYGLASISGTGEAAAQAIIEARPYESFDDFLERRGTKCDSGDIGRLAAVGAFDSMVPNRRALEQRLENTKRAETENLCRWRVEAHLGPGGIPCTFDWTSVPVEVKRDGTPKKNQRGAPKKCTRGCWKYDPIDLADPATMPDYGPHEIREREREMLGLYLSSTPFDDLPEADLAVAATSEQIETAGYGAELFVAGLIQSVRKRTDRRDREMAFLTLETQDGIKVDAVCFADLWAKVRPDVSAGRLSYSIVRRGDRGFQLLGLEPL